MAQITYIVMQIPIDGATICINVMGHVKPRTRPPVPLPSHEFAHPIERRSGVERRRAEPSEFDNVFRPDDRRLGLGRRWEDWCRPPGEHLESSDADLDDLS